MASPPLVGVDQRQLKRVVWLAVSGVVSLGLLAFLSKHVLGHGNLLGLGPLLSLRDEHNLPTYFSSLLLLAASVATAVMATALSADHVRDRRLWILLAAGLFVMSVDESVGLHEALGNSTAVASLLEGAFQGGRPGFLYFGWTAVAIPLLLLLAVLYLPFLARRPAALRWRLLACGGAYVAGAVGLQFLEGWLRSLGTSTLLTSLAYDAATIVEETLEMSAVAAYLLLVTGQALPRGARLELCVR